MTRKYILSPVLTSMASNTLIRSSSRRRIAKDHRKRGRPQPGIDWRSQLRGERRAARRPVYGATLFSTTPTEMSAAPTSLFAVEPPRLAAKLTSACYTLDTNKTARLFPASCRTGRFFNPTSPPHLESALSERRSMVQLFSSVVPDTLQPNPAPGYTTLAK